MKKLAFAAALAFLAASPAQAQDKITFATNWLAQPNMAAITKAIADGTYKKFGLDVTIRPGARSSTIA